MGSQATEIDVEEDVVREEKTKDDNEKKEDEERKKKQEQEEQQEQQQRQQAEAEEEKKNKIKQQEEEELLRKKKEEEEQKPIYDFRAVKKDNPILPMSSFTGRICMIEEFEEPNDDEKLYYLDNKNPVPQPVPNRDKQFYVCYYELRGVVVHHGMTADSGHYYGGYRAPFNFRADYSTTGTNQRSTLPSLSMEEVAKKPYEERMNGAELYQRWKVINDGTCVDMKYKFSDHDKETLNLPKEFPEQVNIMQLLARNVCQASYLLRYHLVRKVFGSEEDAQAALEKTRVSSERLLQRLKNGNFFEWKEDEVIFV